jgi:RHH-type transcriptional regulator, proline utilization regulon repressor / proline dehydrogenase / delta 1-pyrroline-5-carboxylate dehydrogenase
MVAQIYNTYEEKTQAIAKQLISETQEKRSLFDSLSGLDQKILDWTMSNPNLRVQLFRFIDCLPALTNNAEIANHLQEYLAVEEVELPSALKALLSFAQPDSLPGKAAATTITTAVQTLAKKYISGENIQQVIKTVEKLRKDKMAFTIDLLGEAVITEVEAQSYLDRYLELINQLSNASKNWSTVPQIDNADNESLPKIQVSVKLTAFYSQFDPLDEVGSEAKVSDRIRLLLRHAKAHNTAIHFDMEQYVYKNITLKILKNILLEDEFSQRTDIGITLQAYLRDSKQDLEGIIAWAKQRGKPITVRLVKGAYWDQETIKAVQKDWTQPVYNDKVATDANYEAMTQLLLENHQYLYAAIASHNSRTQSKAIAIAQTLNIPKRNIELQVLYGMGDKLAKSLVNKGYRVRVYCPYGDLIPGMAYLIRRLLENTANSSFLRQNTGDTPIDQLISSPFLKANPNSKIDIKPVFPNAPDTDYSLETEQQKAQKALEEVKNQLGKNYAPYINGEYVNTLANINSVNPSNYEQIIGTVGLISIEQAESALKAAKNAFPTWKKTPVRERAGILRKTAEIMTERRHELSAWIVLETGKVVREADAEVSEAIDFCRYYAEEMERLNQGFNYDVSGETNRYNYQGKGIALVISPWNFPLAIAVGMTVAAIVAGNCTLLKPAETSCIIAAKFSEILIASGIPKGVYQFVPGKGSVVGSYMVKHPDVSVIAFTGSQEVGCRIYADAAILQPGQKHLKKVIAEMGGKNAIIVDESADLDQAVSGVVQSAFGYTGQKCSACSRVIVLESIHDTFVERLVEATKSLNIGPTDLPSTKVGPVIDGNAQKRILEYIEIGKKTAHLALQMTVPENGYFVPPTIFTNVKPDDQIAQEEIFGPVLAVIKVKNFTEAMTVANGTNFALTGGLYSRTPSHIALAEKEFEVGNLYINRTITGAIVSRQPFGGFKLSGVGSKAGGPDYLLQFLDPRAITENVQRQGFAPIEGVD